MSNVKLNINSVIGDLDLHDASINLADKVLAAYTLFEKDKTTPGLILLKDDIYYGFLSRVKFFEVMSHQFMYELYSKRKLSHFFEDENSQKHLILNSTITVLEAANEALNRRESDIFEPVVVKLSGERYRLLDFYQLLVAQNRIQLLMNELLKQANEFKKEVLAIAAHDLRNPISAIIGFSDLMSEIDDISQGVELMRYVNKTACQMDDLVNTFLISTINDSTEIEIELSEFNLVDLISTVITSLSHSAEKKKQRIVFTTIYQAVNITSDKLKLQEVLENLLSNAVKYSREQKEIEVVLKLKEDSLAIYVIDQGQGFTESDLKKVFGKFQRLSARPTGNESSTGLGLYIVKKIVNKLSGTIELQSEKDLGSTFTLSFPITAMTIPSKITSQPTLSYIKRLL